MKQTHASATPEGSDRAQRHDPTTLTESTGLTLNCRLSMFAHSHSTAGLHSWTSSCPYFGGGTWWARRSSLGTPPLVPQDPEPSPWLHGLRRSCPVDSLGQRWLPRRLRRQAQPDCDEPPAVASEQVPVAANVLKVTPIACVISLEKCSSRGIG